ncbi:translesion DNA synthesis-associated protein ImuA [Pelomonas cellulosilytica]|uniref:Translesion DNA synthesis-associated protein ImuA n=1 Tax=Pelomonas cellulosilytica TaxID=2906762 RepID=A0ABS8XWD1_9BURK|nr:translesion DNA synthesis-associated protein ImuA [Pelomonas sp. P8]MCE4556238.1 translesion DNA synthesis-associated protein ImuA [Pelomonas sp. P8]
MLPDTASSSAFTPAPARPPGAPVGGPGPLDDALLQGRLWRGSSLGATADPTLPSGFPALDAQLPGGGWPLRAVTELLTPQAGVLEWRLLAPGLRGWWAQNGRPAPPPPGRAHGTELAPRRLLLVNPPWCPHLPGLQALGLPAAALVWVQSHTPAEALWAAEQAIKSRVAVLAWLPEARPEQVRRLQVSALASDAPAFLMRPERAAQQSSAAPLRLAVRPGDGWALDVQLFKRRGPTHEGWLSLPAVPAAVEPLLTANRRQLLPPVQPRPEPAPAAADLSMERADALARAVLLG